jgi:methionyl aminopeptidase
VVELKSPAELRLMRESGRVLAHVLGVVREAAQPGVPLTDLDALAAQEMRIAGAKPSFLHYKPGFATTPYPAVLCTSVNDVIVHGIPSQRRLAPGDLLSLDCAVEIDGYHADSAITVAVGKMSAADQRLVDTTGRALRAGIAAAQVGGRLGDISAAIGAVGRAAGYGIPDGFGGHGIGHHMHEDPSLPNDGTAGRGMKLRPGLALAIEPMFLAGGSDDFDTDPDGWALRTRDGSRAAHIEHSVGITQDGPVVLTATT